MGIHMIAIDQRWIHESLTLQITVSRLPIGWVSVTITQSSNDLADLPSHNGSISSSSAKIIIAQPKMASRKESDRGYPQSILLFQVLIQKEPTRNAIQLRTQNLAPLHAPECFRRRLSSVDRYARCSVGTQCTCTWCVRCHAYSHIGPSGDVWSRLATM